MTSANSMLNIVYLLDLIESQDWDKFEEVALSNPNTFRIISRLISDCRELNGMTLLHACLRYGPPIKILDQMINLYPQALEVQDCLGRTPLHVAAGSGAFQWVIGLLTGNYPEACNIQDEGGHTPLHFACDTSCTLFEGDKCTHRGAPSLDTVRVLLSGSLHAVILEDEDEMNAVEYAIVSGAPIDVVSLLQKATQHVLVMKAEKSRLASSPPQTIAISPSPQEALVHQHVQ